MRQGEPDRRWVRVAMLLLACRSGVCLAQAGSLDAPMQAIPKKAAIKADCPGCVGDGHPSADAALSRDRSGPEFPGTQVGASDGGPRPEPSSPLLEVPGVIGLGSEPSVPPPSTTSRLPR